MPTDNEPHQVPIENLINEHLPAFLKRLSRSTFSCGTMDCCLALVMWWEEIFGFDPAPEFRGSYQTEDQGAEIIAAHGGLVAFVDEIASRVGVVRTEAPKPGDFGVMILHGQEFGAIMGPSGRWSIKARHGMVSMQSIQPIAAWGVTPASAGGA